MTYMHIMNAWKSIFLHMSSESSDICKPKPNHFYLTRFELIEYRICRIRQSHQCYHRDCLLTSAPISGTRGPLRMRQSSFCLCSKASCLTMSTFLSMYPAINSSMVRVPSFSWSRQLKRFWALSRGVNASSLSSSASLVLFHWFQH